MGGVPRARLARLNADGSLDASFDPGAGPDGYVAGLTLLPDGGLLVFGGFQHFGDAARGYLVRLAGADGSLDLTFQPGGAAGIVGTAPFGGSVSALARQPDGQIIVAGTFVSVGGLPRNGFARLEPDGNVDPTFDAGVGTDGLPECLALQADGRVLVGGYFGQVGGMSRHGLARLNADGGVDLSFDPGDGPQLIFDVNGPGPGVNALAVQADGKVLVGGYFDIFGGRALNGVARLAPDGRPDAGWGVDEVPTYLETGVDALALQADGKLLVGGGFVTLAGSSYSGLVRLLGDGPTDPSPSLPSVSVATDPGSLSRATAQAATVTFTRTGGDPTAVLKLNYTFGGSLVAGTDYAVPFTKKIKAGRASASVQLVPLAGGANGKVKLQLLPGEGYTVGAAAPVKVKITP